MAGQRVTVRHTANGFSYLRQAAVADRVAYGMHEWMIANGFEWDGQDGYAWTSTRPPPDAGEKLASLMEQQRDQVPIRRDGLPSAGN